MWQLYRSVYFPFRVAGMIKRCLVVHGHLKVWMAIIRSKSLPRLYYRPTSDVNFLVRPSASIDYGVVCIQAKLLSQRQGYPLQ